MEVFRGTSDTWWPSLVHDTLRRYQVFQGRGHAAAHALRGRAEAAAETARLRRRLLVVTSSSTARPTSKSSNLVRAASTFRLNVMNVSENQPWFSFRGMIRGDGDAGKERAPRFALAAVWATI